jgi:hypothetical protein
MASPSARASPSSPVQRSLGPRPQGHHAFLLAPDEADRQAAAQGAARTADVALLKVGIVVGLEVSRLARNNANWYRLLDLCGITDTLLADADGIYHPEPTSAKRVKTARIAQVTASSGWNRTARQVWLWFRVEGLSFPLQTHGVPDIRWVAPTYPAIHKVLTNPVYAGASSWHPSR